MKHINSYLLIVLSLFVIYSCSDSNSTGPGNTIEEASAERQFIWNAMNFWYFWQEDVPELADDQAFFEDEQAFQDFLMNFDSPRSLFDALQFSAEDDFSFFIEDFEEFMQAQQGVSRDFGFNFGLVRINDTNDVFGYVQFVLDDSPADLAGLIRGDVFTSVNGTRLTVNNFREVLDADNYVLTLADFENGAVTETDETVEVQSVVLEENPIFLSMVLDTGNSRVGYLVYNAFRTNSHQNLNDVFGNFQTENIDELIIDLRYNGGGALVTSNALASLISGLGSSRQFSELTFNPKRSNNNRTESFLDRMPIFNEQGERDGEIAMNKLTSLNRVFILTGFGTASASEVLINSLKPFMDVILVGRQTVGKDEGSITLVDSPAPFTDKSNANPDHKYAIQPIILKIVNSNGEDFPDGFLPDTRINEIDFLDNLPALGDPSEPVLAGALSIIEGQEPVASVFDAQMSIIPSNYKIIFDSNDMKRMAKEMYLLPGEID